MRVSGNFINTLKNSAGQADPRFISLCQPFYHAINDKLQKVDIDQDVKSNSIIAAATLVKVFHSHLPADQMTGIISLFRNRLSNELTRDASLKAVTMIARNIDDNGEAGPIIQL